MEEEQALLTLLRQDLAGYATSWVSDGGVMNVLLASVALETWMMAAIIVSWTVGK